ncbi:MAG: Holliday junction resolvase RuvX [Ignavibacteriae bacterium]|nr:Holliday junction resolvase RuvX [Ignavibacteriota bacterium]MCB9244258.1 Holliday junction resolvase RuvX [Ignavibacteriales bacterium]
MDYGDKRIGVAVSDTDKQYSFQRGILSNDSGLDGNLLELIRGENIEKIILGYPLNLRSEKTELTEKVEQFRAKLEKLLEANSIKADFEFFDERFTSKLARENILSSGLSKKKRRDKGLIDSVSAQIILQDYLDSKQRVRH